MPEEEIQHAPGNVYRNIMYTAVQVLLRMIEWLVRQSYTWQIDAVSVDAQRNTRSIITEYLQSKCTKSMLLLCNINVCASTLPLTHDQINTAVICFRTHQARVFQKVSVIE